MISFIVSAFNEEDNIEATVVTIQSVVKTISLVEYEIIIIDDGSTDKTAERMKTLSGKHAQVVCVHHSTNLGLGSAIRSGLAIARYPQFMIIPGDNDVHHDLVLSMLNFRDGADMVLAAPLNKEIRSIARNVISMLYQLIYMISFRLFINYINGPGIWPTEKARAVGLRARRFAIISELNVKLLRSGSSFVEVPGYFQAGPKGRATVTLRNLAEVVSSYIYLLFEVNLRSRARFASRPRRVPVNLVNVWNKSNESLDRPSNEMN